MTDHDQRNAHSAVRAGTREIYHGERCAFEVDSREIAIQEFGIGKRYACDRRI